MVTHRRKIIIIRGAYANVYELQNYAPIAKKYDIRVITSKNSLTPVPLTTIPLWSPSSIPPFPFRRQILNRLIGGEQWLLGLANVVESGSVVHTAETYTPYTHQAVRLKRKGLIRKLVCTCWETIPHNNEKFSRLRRWKKEAYQYIDVFHTPTNKAKKALILEGVSAEKIIVIPYGVDRSRFKPALQIAHTRPRILTVARLVSEKGMDIIEEVANKLPEFDFLVIGKGNHSPKGVNISVKSVPYNKIEKEFQAADVFFFPSQSTYTWEEQYGMALIEAMSCGLPVIASDSGAIPEITNGYATLVGQKDIEGYCKALSDAVGTNKTKLSPKKYDIKHIARQLEVLYR